MDDRVSQAIRTLLVILVCLLFSVSGCKKQQPEKGVETENAPEALTLTGTDEPPTTYYAPIDACPMPDGLLLVLYARPPNAVNFVDRLVRFDSEGNVDVEFDLDLSFPHTISATGKGTYLITDHGKNRLLEIDGDGTILNQITDRQLGLDGFNFNSGRTTGRDTILASGRDWGIIEFNRDQKLLWKYQLFSGKTPTVQDKGSHDATLLKNGNILYVSTTTNEILEIDRTGRTVKVIREESIRLPKNARRLANGNTIVAHGSGITELDPGGKPLRTTNQWKACYNFKVLPDGGLLLAHTLEGVLFLDRDFQLVKRVRYKAPDSWATLKSSLPPERLEQLRSLGYLQ